jgi:NADPH:quinone reductase-like Zn-dependent oxidoreductase
MVTRVQTDLGIRLAVMTERRKMPKTRAAIFVKPGRILLDEKSVPEVGPLDALARVTTTTICGTDIHILKGEYPVAKGFTIGHEPVGSIEKLGSAVSAIVRGSAPSRARLRRAGTATRVSAVAVRRTAWERGMVSARPGAGNSAI